MSLVSISLTENLWELVSNAKHSVKIGISSESHLDQVASGLTKASKSHANVELHARSFGVNPSRVDMWEKLLANGVQVTWDPDLDHSALSIDGICYHFEEGELRRVDAKDFRFGRAGFFGILKGRLECGQRLAGKDGFSYLLVIERDEKRYPLFAGKDIVSSDLGTGDTLRVAYLSLAGDNTYSGRTAPTEVFLEALSVEVSKPHHNKQPMLWLTTRDEIARFLEDLPVPSFTTKKKEAWVETTRTRIALSLKKRMLYVDADDERYLYARLRRKAGLGVI